MEEIINEFIKEGDRILIYFTNSMPFKGTFIKCYNGFIVANNKMGRTTIMRVEDINRVMKMDIDNPEIAIIEEEPDDSLSISETVSSDNVFEIEKPMQSLKIIGKVNLDEIEPHRKERIRRGPANEGYEVEDDIEEDTGLQILPMGKISAIGPKFGFIDYGRETLYFNIGEVIKGWQNEAPLSKGDDVIFTRSENARGIVAKCVHRPWSVSRQLRTIDNLSSVDTRNAKLLSAQLTEAFPNNEEIRDALYEMRLL